MNDIFKFAVLKDLTLYFVSAVYSQARARTRRRPRSLCTCSTACSSSTPTPPSGSGSSSARPSSPSRPSSCSSCRSASNSSTSACESVGHVTSTWLSFQNCFNFADIINTRELGRYSVEHEFPPISECRNRHVRECRDPDNGNCEALLSSVIVNCNLVHFQVVSRIES